MSTASLVYIKYDPSTATFQEGAKKIVEQGRANGGQFVTYAPAEGGGEAVTVMLHEKGSEAGDKAQAVEDHTRKHAESGSPIAADIPNHGVSKFQSRNATVTHHGNPTVKPFAILFAVSFDAAQTDALKGASEALTSLSYHVVRKEGTPGHALVVVPVDSLDELDAAASGDAQSAIDAIKGAVTHVSMTKMKRLAEYSS